MTGLLIALIVCVVLLLLGIIFQWEHSSSFFFMLSGILAFIYFGTKCLNNLPPEAEKQYSDYGIVVAKEAEPAERGINPWNLKLEYRPDRYKLILKMEDGRRMEMKIDGVGYMQTNIGDRVKYKY